MVWEALDNADGHCKHQSVSQEDCSRPEDHSSRQHARLTLCVFLVAVGLLRLRNLYLLAEAESIEIQLVKYCCA